MPKLSRNFVAGRMNKVVDERLLPDGEYIDAMNIRMGSTEKAEMGVIENTKGNLPLTELYGPNNTQLSIDARCIGAIEDSTTNSIYWFVHDKSFPVGATGICDMIVSFNILTQALTYHVVSIDDGSGVKTTLNFNDKYLITGVNIIQDLLFFTDDYNPPRCININRNYPQPSGLIDAINSEQLLVIKKPPTQAPTIVPYSSGGQENYLDTRFISFAYRYRYIDGEYSATSQWSDVSFVPGPFEFSINSMLNEGMTNSCNSVKVTYNTGGPLVVGVDLLFKQSANNIIKIIEKVDVANLNNVNVTFIFDSSKIFTILPESELLRLYDNVPLFAKAQTIMGNRLMYGNYVEGYDLIDEDGNPLLLDYYTTLVTKNIGLYDLPDSFGTGYYDIDIPAYSVPNSVVYIDFNGMDLNEGSSITISFTYRHIAFTGPLPWPTDVTDEINVDFFYILPTTYTSVYQMATSNEFQEAIGTSLPLGNIKPVYSPIPGADTSCNGITFTDEVNCDIPNSLNTFQKYASGISADGQAIAIITTPASTQIGFQIPAMRFVDNLVTPTQNVYEYYEITFAKASFQEIASPKSLHSNRDYEIGIVYMDEFNRSSTALVSPYNTIHVPCGYSANQNSIQVTIPTSQVAPYWAKRYKFVIKPSAEFYETIYCNFFFRDPGTNEAWFFLEGENSEKVETGDRLIVKTDSSGPTQSCVYATVLEKATKGANFVTLPSGVQILGGTYMRLNPSNFNAVEDPLAIIAPGEQETYAPPTSTGAYNKLDYPVNIEDPNAPGTYIDYDIPAGSRIYMKIDLDRPGKSESSPCTPRGYFFEKTYTAGADYANFEDWFKGSNIDATLDLGNSIDGTTSLEFIEPNGILSTFSFDTCYLQFYRYPLLDPNYPNKLVLQVGTGLSCSSFTPLANKNYKRYYVRVEIAVYRAENKFVFETEPSEASPDVFFENNLSFAIDSFGNHMGNVQDQDISLSVPAIVDTEFFNCFSFGNGVESYKIRDSIVGKYFTLGERVNTVSAQNYKRADRFSDITYSGIYNPETNVNKLNEFNLGLLNYKNLEASFGSIYILDGRETDVLALQEDKISYVLAGKNLLSDAAAGGAITSVPEVLGTQIARTEKYGISFNPESYVQWGYNRYFTDVKRGVVVNIIGESLQQDQLSIISEANMRTWFRDEFNKSFNTQKLGGFDPYMNEYVLHTNDIKIPFEIKCIDCGVVQALTLQNEKIEEASTTEFCVNLGPYIGDASVSWNVISNASSDDFQIDVTYNSIVYTSGLTNATTGTITFPKNLITEQVATILITYTSPLIQIEITPSCPDADELNIVEVVLTNNVEVGDTTHIEYRYNYGAYTSPLQSIPVTFISSSPPPVVSHYNIVPGLIGGPSFPPPGSLMRIQSTQIPPDSFVFNPYNDKFRYYQSNVLYPNTTSGIQSLISVSSLATPILGSGVTFYSNFVVPGGGSYLYLIWDFRDSIPTQLCHEDPAVEDAQKEVCCNCQPCAEPCITVSVYNPGEEVAEVFFPFGDDDCGGENAFFSVEVGSGDTWTGCIDNVGAEDLWEVISGQPVITVTNCACGELPENLTPPMLSYTTLYPGDIITTNDGSWINV